MATRPATGALRVASRPPGAKIRGQDGSDTHQVTPAVIAGLPPGQWSFTLELAGYLPTPVRTAAVAGQTRTVEVALSPALVPLSKNAAGFEEFRNVKDGMVLIAIPGGSFEMGADDGDPDEKPVHRVTLSPYHIGKHEVSWRQYLEFCRETHHPRPMQTVLQAPAEDHPVRTVSWLDAQAYCKWAGLRLPTEAQWEYAARGRDGRKYPWGNDAPGAGGIYRANGVGAADGFEETAPLGSFGPDAKPPRTDGSSPFGALDMAGSVWEWCQDSKGDYPAKPVMDPRGPDQASDRVLRGGGWLNDAPNLRVADRNGNTPGNTGGSYGFRCAR